MYNTYSAKTIENANLLRHNFQNFLGGMGCPLESAHIFWDSASYTVHNVNIFVNG